MLFPLLSLPLSRLLGARGGFGFGRLTGCSLVLSLLCSALSPWTDCVDLVTVCAYVWGDGFVARFSSLRLVVLLSARTRVQVNMLIGGVDKKGPALHYMDYMASTQPVHPPPPSPLSPPPPPPSPPLFALRGVF